MRVPLRSAFAAAAATAVVLFDTASAQTWSLCNPLNTQCPPNTALGMTVNVDFRKGGVNSFAASGSPKYDSDGVAFSVARGGDAPQLNSLFYIMFGRVDIVIKAAPGAGIVSSLVLESDDLDEIDIEWLGADPDEMQSNYFGKGKTTSNNRGKFHAVQGTQTRWVKYTVDWTKDRIVWMADDKVLRELKQSDAEQGQYPQTPMRVKVGAWAGGDPNYNAPGTVKWARGPTDYSKGPFAMHVQSLRIADYSSGKEYRYKDQTGSWESIEAVGGSVNGNLNNRNALTVTATATSGPAATTFATVPVGGIGRDGSTATRTQTGWPWVAGASPTGGTIPSGWYMTPEGKIMRSNTGAAAPSTGRPTSLLAAVVGSVAVGALSLLHRLY
ncbi:extracellular cell wall glucanase Crf1 [Purpureocillium lavendulum]|uniref:chitinase n=1 Tax=Purpureocillium lavendulum TaxID=1247861 RepID=A0AB34G3W2_9HYPO|nr:extracellular cell wall glucanase Crf1 [Purpureocillium lavendulum]